MRRLDGLRVDRLKKLANFLDELPENRFKFYEVVDGTVDNAENEHPTVKECGSTACAVGWIPSAFPRGNVHYIYTQNYSGEFSIELGRNGQAEVWDEIAREFFGLSIEEVYALFSPSEGWAQEDKECALSLGLEPLTEMAKPKDVASNIRKFLKVRTSRKGICTQRLHAEEAAKLLNQTA